MPNVTRVKYVVAEMSFYDVNLFRILSGLTTIWTSFSAELFSIIGWIYTGLFVLLFLVSSFGKYVNIRKKYIQTLCSIFEFGSRKFKEKKILRDVSTSADGSLISSDSYDSELAENAEIKVRDGFKLEDTFPLITSGIGVIMEDQVMSSFESQPLQSWNFLSRNNSREYQRGGLRIWVFWVVGFFIRYIFLLPVRFSMLILWSIVFMICTTCIGCLPDGELKRKLNAKATVTCFDFVGGCLSLAATFYNDENRPLHSVAVANHTSPIDSMVLATDNCYDMVGQTHDGVLGYFMRLLSRSSSHIWFERSVAKDRANVMEKMHEHVQDKSLPPILIFPEGVCVNNTAVMQFKKGAFELDTEVFPMAIRYDPRFGEPFWHQDTFFPYIMSMMTSWAIVCDIWYLPPMKKLSHESSIEFAARVKAKIAEKAGLQVFDWDGKIKSRPVSDTMKESKQRDLAEKLAAGDSNAELRHRANK